MKTPICNFVENFAKGDPLRLHMPGHKGVELIGGEHLDITEVPGADSLYEAGGIIGESEKNASALFGCPTFYSTEGSSQCIRAMLYLAMLHAKEPGRRPMIAAGRNAHKTFLSGAALLDLDVMWLYPKEGSSYLSCSIAPEELDSFLSACEEKPSALYITSPDYLGRIADIRGLSQVCRSHGLLLLVDNAHGAYLRFLDPSMHPMDLGADMCCDSAHKTLPVLTGGAYLHISPSAPSLLKEQAKDALALFGSTSPSYLIMQSLDRANAHLEHEFPDRLGEFSPFCTELSNKLKSAGYTLYGDEPLKITIAAKEYGYTGTELSDILLEQGIVVEFADPDFTVFMLAPAIGKKGLDRLERALLAIPQRTPVKTAPPAFDKPERAMGIREAMLSPGVSMPVEKSVGRILSAASVGCPPAVPIAVCGEVIDEAAVAAFRYYGIENCTVIK